eukprot:TRINITY_DN116046_c0_g1_i1.p1 TRINITY_DN116046_c0_g1~~TRINITY_DN116046_c0_g1_i1.p1  ORF type:complete len:299 (+),score=49.83 TRINITY_DN116046_c0_g1_i1:50-898(+)
MRGPPLKRPKLAQPKVTATLQPLNANEREKRRREEAEEARKRKRLEEEPQLHVIFQTNDGVGGGTSQTYLLRRPVAALRANGDDLWCLFTTNQPHRSLRVLKTGVVDHKGAQGPWAQFKMTKSTKRKNYYTFQHPKTGRYLVTTNLHHDQQQTREERQEERVRGVLSNQVVLSTCESPTEVLCDIRTTTPEHQTPLLLPPPATCGNKDYTSQQEAHDNPNPESLEKPDNGGNKAAVEISVAVLQLWEMGFALHSEEELENLLRKHHRYIPDVIKVLNKNAEQ